MSKIQTATIATADNRFPFEPELIDNLTEKAGVLAFDNIQSDDRKFTFRDGPTTYAVTLMDGPVPWSQLQTPCANAWYWPEAALEMQRHTNHLIVGVLDDEVAQIERNLKLSHLTAAVAGNSGIAPVGVLWNPTAGTDSLDVSYGLIHRPKDFVAHCAEISPDALPLELWISFIPSQCADGSFLMSTRGLESFGMKELEISVTPEYLLNNKLLTEEDLYKMPEWVYHRMFNFAHYCLDHPVQVKAGETIGMSDNEKIDIIPGFSRFDSNRQVLYLNVKRET